MTSSHSYALLTLHMPYRFCQMARPPVHFYSLQLARGWDGGWQMNRQFMKAMFLLQMKKYAHQECISLPSCFNYTQEDTTICSSQRTDNGATHCNQTTKKVILAFLHNLCVFHRQNYTGIDLLDPLHFHPPCACLCRHQQTGIMFVYAGKKCMHERVVCCSRMSQQWH